MKIYLQGSSSFTAMFDLMKVDILIFCQFKYVNTSLTQIIDKIIQLNDNQFKILSITCIARK